MQWNNFHAQTDVQIYRQFITETDGSGMRTYPEKFQGSKDTVARLEIQEETKEKRNQASVLLRWGKNWLSNYVRKWPGVCRSTRPTASRLRLALSLVDDRVFYSMTMKPSGNPDLTVSTLTWNSCPTPISRISNAQPLHRAGEIAESKQAFQATVIPMWLPSNFTTTD